MLDNATLLGPELGRELIYDGGPWKVSRAVCEPEVIAITGTPTRGLLLAFQLFATDREVYAHAVRVSDVDAGIPIGTSRAQYVFTYIQLAWAAGTDTKNKFEHAKRRACEERALEMLDIAL